LQRKKKIYILSDAPIAAILQKIVTKLGVIFIGNVRIIFSSVTTVGRAGRLQIS
jgi:hypothetical protein